MLLLIGGTGLFAAPKVATWLGAPASGVTSVIVQIAASGTLGPAVMNWFSRKNRIGGIYARPLCLANLLFFFSSALWQRTAIYRAGRTGLRRQPGFNWSVW